MMRRDLFDRTGGFDPGLPACEDYDLWLRVAVDTPVWLIDRPLVVRRGGHPDQLSRRYWGMDRFRVASLLRLLASRDLAPPRRDLVRAVVAEKCAVLAAGAARRGRHDEAERYRTLARLCP
jgi:GT2 family glycosyltransferase